MASSVIPIIDPDWLKSVQAKNALKNAKWHWSLSVDEFFSKKHKKVFERLSWLHLFIWAGWREDDD